MPDAAAHEPPLLDVRELCTELAGAGAAPVPLVDHVSLHLARAESLGLVGESGCGKTMLALSLLRLLPPAVRVASGQVLFGGRDLLALGEQELRALRGDRLAMVFQEPLSALNPVLKVGEQVAEALQAHGRSRGEARRLSLELLERVGVVPAGERARAYPHQLSGGLRQRVLLAMAVACSPDLLIADEPTTALDPTLQAQVLELLLELQRSSGLALLLISHDLGVVGQACQRVAVLYAGQVVEEGRCADLFSAPRHPYTRALLEASRALHGARGQELPELPGAVAGPSSQRSGCRFAPRCVRADAACLDGEPALEAVDGGARWFRCRHPLGAPGKP